MERKLAHIEVIENLTPIKNADKIEVAHILGWQCIVKKNDFKIGDKVIYIEIDSVLPESKEFEFLRSRNFRVKTIKLKGQISQGLVLPIYEYLGLKQDYFKEGDDVTTSLGVVKYLSTSERKEIEQQNRRIANQKNKFKKFIMRYSWYGKWFLSKKEKTSFPFWVSKTDEERIQNIPHVLEQFKDKTVYVTEKIDYQSVTFTGQKVKKYSWLGKLSPLTYKFIVCSRNLVNNDKNSLYWKIAKKYNIEDILKNYPNLTIQGEQGNTNIQGNKYALKEPTLWIFNIINHKTNYRYDYYEMLEFCKKYNLQCVPLIAHTKLELIGSSVEDLVKYSTGKSTLANIEREGVVIRAYENGNKLLSFKVTNPQFLLKYNE